MKKFFPYANKYARSVMDLLTLYVRFLFYDSTYLFLNIYFNLYDLAGSSMDNIIHQTLLEMFKSLSWSISIPW